MTTGPLQEDCSQDRMAGYQAALREAGLRKDASFKLADFYKQPVDELTNGGKIYGLPRDISTMVTYYNADRTGCGLNSPEALAGAEYAVAEAPVWKGNWADYSAKVQEMWDLMIAGKLSPEDFTAQVCDKSASAFTK